MHTCILLRASSCLGNISDVMFPGNITFFHLTVWMIIMNQNLSSFSPLFHVCSHPGHDPTCWSQLHLPFSVRYVSSWQKIRVILSSELPGSGLCLPFSFCWSPSHGLLSTTSVTSNQRRCFRARLFIRVLQLELWSYFKFQLKLKIAPNNFCK